MAVSPLRALLVARGQALVNGLRREAGGAGLAGLALVALALPGALASATVPGWLTGRNLGALLFQRERSATALAVLAGLLTCVPLALGLAGGLLGRDEAPGLDLRPHPVARRQRLEARLAAGLVSLPGLLGCAWFAGLGLGLAAAAPAVAPLSLLLCAQGAGWTLLVRQAVSALRAASLARARGAVAALGLLALVLGLADWTVVVGPCLALGARVLPWSPATLGLAGLQDLAEGRLGAGLWRQALPFAATLLALELAARWGARDEEGEPAAAAGRGPERPWSFGRPARGAAILFVDAVLRSRAGLTVFLTPAFLALAAAVTAGLLRGARHAWPPALAALPQPPPLEAWPLFGLLPFVALWVSSDLWLNQWGWDGRAVRAWFLAPAPLREVLLGKLIGLGAIWLGQVGLAAPLLAALRPARLAEAAWGAGAGLFALLAFAGLGHVLSAGFPRLLDERGRLSRAESPASSLAGLLAAAAVAAPIAFAHALARPLGPWGPPLATALLAGLGAALYWQALPLLARRVHDLRETLLEAS